MLDGQNISYDNTDTVTETLNCIHRQERKNMDEMTSQELNQYLETIAELIEAKAKTPQDAAEIVRSKKIGA